MDRQFPRIWLAVVRTVYDEHITVYLIFSQGSKNSPPIFELQINLTSPKSLCFKNCTFLLLCFCKFETELIWIRIPIGIQIQNGSGSKFKTDPKLQIIWDPAGSGLGSSTLTIQVPSWAAGCEYGLCIICRIQVLNTAWPIDLYPTTV